MYAPEACRSKDQRCRPQGWASRWSDHVLLCRYDHHSTHPDSDCATAGKLGPETHSDLSLYRLHAFVTAITEITQDRAGRVATSFAEARESRGVV